LRSLRKDNSGYDLKHLFIGAEGTLGIITAAVLKLYPRPQAEAVACVAVRDPEAAVALLSHLRATCGDKISAFEIIARSCLDLVFKHIPDTREPFTGKHEWIVITQLADVLLAPLDAALREALRSFGAGIIEFDITSNKDHAEHWWKLRKNISEAQKREGISIKHDVSVPISRIAEFIARADAALRNAFPGIRNRDIRTHGRWQHPLQCLDAGCRTKQNVHRTTGRCGEQAGICSSGRTQRQHQRRARPGTTEARCHPRLQRPAGTGIDAHRQAGFRPPRADESRQGSVASF